MSRLGRNCARLLLPTLLTGCAKFGSQPLDPAQPAADLEFRSLADPGLRRFLMKTQTDLTEAQALEGRAHVADALVKAQQALGQIEDAVQVPFAALKSVEQNPRAPAQQEPK